jgi:N-acetylglucosaminyldiphosphoundecaprenol N-acetyl-beta-D-mannosaminyltransferase
MVFERILGMKVNPLTYTRAVEQIRLWLDEYKDIQSKGSRFVSISAVNNVVNALKNPTLMDIQNSADMVTTDGMPLVWILKSRGHKDCSRVYGPTLMLHTLSMAEEQGHPVYFYGCTDAILQELEKRLQRKYPKLRIAGSFSPPFRPLTEEENKGIVQKIQESGAKIVFVGLSTPKQEQWMYLNRDKLHNTVLMGVGAAFLFHAGEVKQAPSWIQKIGMEWFFRLCCEPKRLWKRYILGNSYFVWKLITHRNK